MTNDRLAAMTIDELTDYLADLRWSHANTSDSMRRVNLELDISAAQKVLDKRQKDATAKKLDEPPPATQPSLFD